jgi:hypothetical protein
LFALENEGYAHWTTPPYEDKLCLRARAALAEPDGPAVQSREPASVTTEPSDEELRQLYCELFMLRCDPSILGTGPMHFARAVLARWGT